MKFENAKNRNNGNGKKYIFSSILFIVFLVVFSFSSYGQDTDNTEFWFVAPDVSIGHNDSPTFLMITTGDKPATVTLSMPANANGFTPVTETIEAYSYWKVTFGRKVGTGQTQYDYDYEIDLIENDYTSSGTPTNRGIFIKSDVPVSAYYQLEGTGTQREIFTLKGKKALGEEFYMPFQTTYNIDDRWNDAFRQIQIVATEDDTEITITPKGDLAIGTTSSTPAGTPVKRTLNKGQTLLWRGHLRETNNLAGSHIKADGPIAVTLFEDCIRGGTSADPIGDQLVPVNSLGKNYIIVKGYSSGTVSDHVVIVAAHDGTRVLLDGVDQGVSLNKGTAWEKILGNNGAYYISTTQPVYCMHQSANGTEIGGALLPSLYSISGRRITFMKGKTMGGTSPNNAMFLVFRDTAIDGFTLNGNSIENFNPIEIGFDRWYYAKVDLPEEEMICTVANEDGSFALGYFNGNSNQTSLYGYLSAFGTFAFESDTIYACHSHIFDAPYALTYDWHTPEGPKNVSRFETTKSGRYILEVNQDPYTLKDTTYLKVQNFNHILSAPERLLVEKPYNFNIELNPEKDPDNYFRATYEWDFGAGAVVVSGSLHEHSVEVHYTTPGTKQITLHITNLDANCSTTITHEITIVDASEGRLMYWKSNTENRDWNDVNNWASDAVGTSIMLVPAEYTRVYLPGIANNYPSLSEENTDWRFYGQPEADEIIFRYGSELHHQHKLKYNKAYVNYNWGYYDGDFSTEEPQNSLENGIKLPRNTWHMLAAPLKSMASGDFSLAGRPFSWQRQFQVINNPPEGSVTVGDFSTPFSTNDMPLAGNNNAIAVKMAEYRSGETGYREQDYLENLEGVIEIPYFENNDVVQHYPAHSYDVLSRNSYFYYFDTRTLRIIPSPKGSMKRVDAYRFVYEDVNGNPPSDGIYKADIVVPEGATEVMVGNPLLVSIVSTDFLTENGNTIDESYGYKLLSEDGQTWVHYNFTAANLIPAWKAFIVQLKEEGIMGRSGRTSTLNFPLEFRHTTASVPVRPVTYATRVSNVVGMADDALYVQVLKGGTCSSDVAKLQYNRHTDKPDIRKMILPEGHKTPEVFFISADGKSSNLIQQYRQGEKEVAIGIKTSDVQTRLSLEFDNIAAFSASTGSNVVLVDKHQDIRQDLTRNPIYSFTQQVLGLDNQYVDRHRFVLKLGSNTGPETEEDAIEGINIVYRSSVLEITSNENIHTVSVYDLHGRLVFSNRSVNLPRYNHPLSLQGKIYLVRVKTVSGKEKVRRIVGN